MYDLLRMGSSGSTTHIHRPTKTGKRSQAGCLSAFASRRQRDDFIVSTNGMAGAVTAKQARQLKAGLDERAFNELVTVLVGGDA
ncbi:hypothetical protein ACK3YP_18445 [Aeromonas allosaccharophila]|uniref:hypothetical protein n=1 Tax=Aeromonas allosaccharophila TaxID=656 RepID=UPI0039878EAD